MCGKVLVTLFKRKQDQLYHLNCDHQIQLRPIHYYFLTYFKHGGHGFDL